MSPNIRYRIVIEHARDLGIRYTLYTEKEQDGYSFGYAYYLDHVPPAILHQSCGGNTDAYARRTGLD